MNYNKNAMVKIDTLKDAEEKMIEASFKNCGLVYFFQNGILLFSLKTLTVMSRGLFSRVALPLRLLLERCSFF